VLALQQSSRQTSSPRHSTSRYFSVQTATATTDHENFVKEAIKKMMLDRDSEDDIDHLHQHAPISDEELKSRFESFQVRGLRYQTLVYQTFFSRHKFGYTKFRSPLFFFF
jgi:hypothetical protein